MTRGLLVAAAAVAALSIAACNKKPETDAGAAANQAVNQAQDATSAAVGQTSAATLGSHDTGAFVSNLTQSGMYEIEAGKMASTMAKSAGVKAFGKMMVIDHTAMDNEVKPLIAAAGQTPATALDERRKGLLDNLKTSTNFDKDYIDQQVAAHEEALTLLKGYADNGGDAGLKAAAAKASEKVQAHLDKAKQIQSGLK